MSCLFIYNPVSGRGKIAKKLPRIRKTLQARFERVDIYETKSGEDLESHLKECADRYGAVVFSGGDGTFNKVIGALEGRDVQLGYLPTGTVNDVARSLKIPRRINGALKVIAAGHAARLDCIKAGDSYAMYIAAAGAFTSATYHTAQSQKKMFGALAYFFEAVKHNMKFDVFPVKAVSGGQTVETSAVLVLVMNGKSVAGFPINKDGSMADGKLETVIIKQVEKPGFFRKIGALFSVASLFVFGCRIRKRDILYLHGERVKIETDGKVRWDLDGEEGFCGNAEMEVCRGAVRLFVPKNKKI